MHMHPLAHLTSLLPLESLLPFPTPLLPFSPITVPPQQTRPSSLPAILSLSPFLSFCRPILVQKKCHGKPLHEDDDTSRIMIMMMAGKHMDKGMFLIDQGMQSSGSSSTCGGASAKRLKVISESGFSKSKFLSTRERKDKIGERVSVLQNLVSPFGKTDTASVLQEASDYIRFLHEQVQVLSSPYLRTPAMKNSQGPYSHSNTLRSRGLCLVPLSLTLGLASDNGADIWASRNNSLSPRF